MGVQRPPLTALWVDLGLPSGNRWAVSNLDAAGPYFFQESPFKYECSFFSWGNVTPHNPKNSTSFDYNFGGVNSSAPYYEGQRYGDTPGSKLTGNIPLSNDAARIMLGNPWRMPSAADFTELISYTSFIDANGNELPSTTTDKRVTVNGVIGIYLQSKINGARLFFSCSGIGYGQMWTGKANYGQIWSTTFVSERNSRYIFFGVNRITPQDGGARSSGLPIRPIWKPDDLR